MINMMKHMGSIEVLLCAVKIPVFDIKQEEGGYYAVQQMSQKYCGCIYNET